MADPAALRAAADVLIKVMAEPPGYTRGALITDALMHLPDGPARTALWGMQPNQWMFGAARIRLLLEALTAEHRARREIVSGAFDGESGYSCIHCGNPAGGWHSDGCDGERCDWCGSQRIGCGCEEDQIVALVKELMAGGAGS